MTPNHSQPEPMTAITSGRLLTPAEVADFCHISSKTVLRAIRAGHLRASQLGSRGAYRMRMQDVDAWIGATTVPPALPRLRPTQPSTLNVDQIRKAPVARGATAGRLVLTSDMGRAR
jgi:excisionase family DNA binding protein